MPSYPVGGNAIHKFNVLNAQRKQCGSGVPANREALRKAAEDQASYLDANYVQMAGAGSSPHSQYARFPNGYTGATALDRIRSRVSGALWQ